MNTFYVILPIFLASIGLIEPGPTSNSTEPSANLRYADYCYYCTSCPVPFRSSSPYVTQVGTTNGWCGKSSYSSAPGALASRYAPPNNFCYANGCSWRGNQFICCCDGTRCNGASEKSYSVMAVLGMALMMLFRS